MPEVNHFRLEDRPDVDALYRRVFGHDAADASRLRWDWQYRRNPNNPSNGPQIWIAREGRTVIGQYATMPVRLVVKGQEIDGSWGMDVMVAPERQRRGLGEVLFRTWDRHVGASLGLGLSESSYRLFQKLNWPDVGPLACLVKPLTARALVRSRWSPLTARVVSTLCAPLVAVIGRLRAESGNITRIRRFDESFSDLWSRVAPRFDLAVRRDARYLNWKFAEPPHVRYTLAALQREARTAGYAVFRHLQEPRGRVTLLVDFLVDPDDVEGFRALVAHVDREARAAGSDKIRTFAMHDAFRKGLRRCGFFQVKSTVEFTIKVNAVSVDSSFYNDTARWHVTLGDSDQDR